jgi:hypothetical protein
MIILRPIGCYLILARRKRIGEGTLRIILDDNFMRAYNSACFFNFTQGTGNVSTIQILENT